MVAVGNTKSSIDTSTLLSDVASFASTLGFSSATGSSSGFNDTDFRKVGPIKPASKPSSLSQKNLPRKKFNAKRQERNVESAAGFSGFNDSDFRKGAPMKPAPRPSSQFQKNLPRNKFNGKKEERNVAGNRKGSQGFKEDFRTDSVAEIDEERFKNLPKLPLLKSSTLGAWHRDATELEDTVIGNNKNIETGNVGDWEAFVEKKKELGQRLLAQYVQDYWSTRGRESDIKMLVSTQRSGTAADKVSALSILIGDNPVANLKAIDSMLGMVTSKVGKRHAFTAFGSLREIFIILLPDRKLKTLIQRPLNYLPENKDGHSLLLFWFWEECLKDRYEKFISALEGASLDVVIELKSLALKTIYILLKSKPEQERRLLSSLVNKLGDPENKVASNADYHLANLLAEHPKMKSVVIDEVDNFLFRPHLAFRAKYHAVNFLSQIYLSHKADGQKAAKRLIDIYFALFKVLISEAGAPQASDKNQKKKPNSLDEDKSQEKSGSLIEMDSRLLSGILTGVNRAFPYLHSDEADDVVQVQTPLLFQMVHSKNFNVGVQALMLLDKIASKNQVVSDRFYRALYSKLLLPSAMISSKEEMLIALILRAMKNDVNIKRVAAFSKRLLQVSLQLPPQYACGFLFLLSEVLKARPPLWNMMLQSGAAAAEDEDLEHFVDIPDNDDTQASPATDTREENKTEVLEFNNDEEAADMSSDEGSIASPGSDTHSLDGDDFFGEASLSKFEETNSGSDNKMQKLPDPVSINDYNPRHREPSFCNADRVGWWELSVLASHVHPSVAAMAKTLLSGANILYNGNPLADLSLPSFLDKFMEKKPKQTVWHGASQIEPARKIDMNHQLIGPEILSLTEADIPPGDVVFHKFYMNKMNSSKKPKKKKKKKTEEDEEAEELYAVNGNDEDDDQSDNEEIEDLLDSVTAPSLGSDGEYDYDDLDRIANDDDDDELIEDASDPETDALSEEYSDEVEDDDNVENDDNENESVVLLEESGKKKRKHGGASPFASLEDYKHMMEDEPKLSTQEIKKKHKSKKHKP